jgi:tetraacyldisaccharide 4'-kinase
MIDLRDFAWLPVNTLYGAATAVRRGLYRAGVFGAVPAPVPVISVGNISAGGTGKTPLVIWLVEQLSRSDLKICVLTRGYGRPNPNDRLMVSDGQTVFHDAARAGDEAVLMAEALLGRAAVACAADRAAATEWAVENLGAGLIILDDGFQHFQLERAFDLVAVDASRPFEGLQREGLGSLRRADALVVTRSELNDDLPTLLGQLERESAGRPIFTAQTQTTEVRSMHGSVPGSSPDKKLPMGAFCGIGNPESFFAGLRREGFELVYRRALRDHAEYSQPSLDEIAREAKATGAQFLLTTAKDEVKLRGLSVDLPVFVLDTNFLIDRPDLLLQLVNDRIKSAASSS